MLSDPRFGSCLAPSRVAAALVIFVWRLLAAAVLVVTPSTKKTALVAVTLAVVS